MQKSFIKRWLGFLLLLCFYSTIQSQTIKKVEYFFDTDPGVGNGSQINLAHPSSIDSTFTFDVSALTNGLHLIYVRSQDDSLKWSLNYSTSFLKTSGGMSSMSVKRLEYFIDTDPGVGNGTPINLAQANVIDSILTFDVSTLTNGLHLIYIRAQDDNLNWSLNYSTSFVKVPGNDSLLSVTQLEYFLDTDPGFGNGISIPIQQAP
ncbi:MAG: hypothetical protein ACMG51_11065, partial [Ginsengibacter sp.]